MNVSIWYFCIKGEANFRNWQGTFARYTERTAFERPLTSGVAYAVRVLHSEREQFEEEQGWKIKSMDALEQTPVHKHDYNLDSIGSSPFQEEYAPVIFAQDTVSHVISLDMLSGKVSFFCNCYSQGSHDSIMFHVSFMMKASLFFP